MTDRMSTLPHFDYDEYARTKDPEDYWGQVRRAVHGRPIGDDQINLIIEAIISALKIEPTDVILDLACGNGALSSHLFHACAGLHGVDLSEFLIEVAKSDFEQPPRYTFSVGDVCAYLEEGARAHRFSKALCYGSFAYLSESEAIKALTLLRTKYAEVSRIFIGNLPDYDRREQFFAHGVPPFAELKWHRTPIGIWRSMEEFSQLAWRCGWEPVFSLMPSSFFAASYRYDVVLQRTDNVG